MSYIDTIPGWHSLPAGDFVCEIVNTNITDGILSVEMSIAYGHHKGGKLHHRIYIGVTDDKRSLDEEMKTLSKMIVATGLNSPVNDSVQLHGLFVIVTVTADNGVNNIVGYAKPSLILRKERRLPVEYIAPEVLQ